MDFINEIVKETIIICSSGSKDKIIGMNLLKPIKIMTIDEFIKNYYFSYEEDAITYVMHEYSVRYEVALGYIKNIYYVLNKSYGNKLDMLVDIKNKLIDKGLLKYNSYFLDYIRNKEIIIYDMDLDRFYLNMFEGLNYKVIDRKYHNYSHFAICSIDFLRPNSFSPSQHPLWQVRMTALFYESLPLNPKLLSHDIFISSSERSHASHKSPSPY